MKSIIAVFLIVAALSAQAQSNNVDFLEVHQDYTNLPPTSDLRVGPATTLPNITYVNGLLVENDGLRSILARHKRMEHVERPVAQRMDNGSILSVYADDSVTTQAVSLVRMSPSTTAKVEALAEDRETLKAAKALVKQIKSKHGDKVTALADSEIVAASEAVFNTSKKDAATGAAVGALLGAAALAVGKNKKQKAKT